MRPITRPTMISTSPKPSFRPEEQRGGRFFAISSGPRRPVDGDVDAVAGRRRRRAEIEVVDLDRGIAGVGAALRGLEQRGEILVGLTGDRAGVSGKVGLVVGP